MKLLRPLAIAGVILSAASAIVSAYQQKNEIEEAVDKALAKREENQAE